MPKLVTPGALDVNVNPNSASRAMGSQIPAPTIPQTIPLTPVRGQASVIEGWSEEESFIIEETASVTDRVVPVLYQTRSAPVPRVNPTPKAVLEE